MDMEMWVALGSIILINLVLSGDNAVVIALASRGLPPDLQKKAIFWGTFGAIFFRIILTFVAAYLLQIPYLQFIGGLALLYIAIKLIAPAPQSLDGKSSSGNLGEAIKIILTADVIMSLDNVLAIAGVAAGNYVLLLIGLIMSIPIVIYGSTFLASIMDKYPIIIYAGAGVLGWTAAKMVVWDTAFNHILSPYALPIEIFLTIVTLAAGYWLKKKQERALPKKSRVV